MVGTMVDLGELVRPRKRCGVPLVFRHKVNRDTVMVKRVSCGSWHCDECGSELRQKWLAHLTRALQSSKRLYVSHVEKARWRTLSKRILRAGGQSATIEQAGEYLVVLTDAPVGESVSPAVALSLLEQAIMGAATVLGKRPIHTSRGWGLPKGVVPAVSQWERVARLSMSLEEARKIVKESGLRASSFFGDFASGFVVHLLTQEGEDEDMVFRGFVSRLKGLSDAQSV